MLTEELRAEIQREVESRFLELLREGITLRQFVEGPPEQVKGSVPDYSTQIAAAISEGHARAIRVIAQKPIDIDEFTKFGRLFDFSVSFDQPEANPGTAGAFGTELGTRVQPLKQLVRVVARAVEVLGTSDKALRWFNTPVRSLGDKTPVSLLNSPDGIVRVEDALGRIEHGIW